MNQFNWIIQMDEMEKKKSQLWKGRLKRNTEPFGHNV